MFISKVIMRFMLILAIVLVFHLNLSKSDPSKNIDHLKKKGDHPEIVKKHSAKREVEHHEFNHKKGYHLGEDGDEKNKNKKMEIHKTKVTGDSSTTSSTLSTKIIHNKEKDSDKEEIKTTVIANQDKMPKSQKVKDSKKKTRHEEAKDAKILKSKDKENGKSHQLVEKDSAASSERVEDSTKKSSVTHQKDSNNTSQPKKSSKEKGKSPEADAVKAEKSKGHKHKDRKTKRNKKSNGKV